MASNPQNRTATSLDNSSHDGDLVGRKVGSRDGRSDGALVHGHGVLHGNREGERKEEEGAAALGTADRQRRSAAACRSAGGDRRRGECGGSAREEGKGGAATRGLLLIRGIHPEIRELRARLRGSVDAECGRLRRLPGRTFDLRRRSRCQIIDVIWSVGCV